ncbi:MAG: hypothetical protein JO291_13030 [Acidimicrobiia bacterium]|nr:hypothetical protein [Acidimicrobiia bacterium]
MNEILEQRLRSTLRDDGGEPATRLGLNDVRQRAAVVRRTQRRRRGVGVALAALIPLVAITLVATRAGDSPNEVQTATTGGAAAAPLPRLVPSVLPQGLSVRGAGDLPAGEHFDPDIAAWEKPTLFFITTSDGAAVLNVRYMPANRSVRLGWDETATAELHSSSTRSEATPGVHVSTRSLPGHREAEVTSTSLSQRQVDELADSLEPIAGGSPLDWRPTRPASAHEDPVDRDADGYAIEAHDGSRSAPGIQRARFVDISVVGDSPHALDVVEESNASAGIGVIDIHGHRAHIYDPVGAAGSDHLLVRWVVDDAVIAVTSRGLPRDEVIAVARGLRSVSDDEWRSTLSGGLAAGLDPNGASSAVVSTLPHPAEGTLADGSPWSMSAVGHDDMHEVEVSLYTVEGSASGTVELPASSDLVATTVQVSATQRAVVGWTSGSAADVRVVDGRGAEHTVRAVPVIVDAHGQAFVVTARNDQLAGPLRVVAGGHEVSPATVHLGA